MYDYIFLVGSGLHVRLYSQQKNTKLGAEKQTANLRTCQHVIHRRVLIRTDSRILCLRIPLPRRSHLAGRTTVLHARGAATEAALATGRDGAARNGAIARLIKINKRRHRHSIKK